MQKAPDPNHPRNPVHNEKAKSKVTGIEESKDSQYKVPANSFNNRGKIP